MCAFPPLVYFYINDLTSSLEAASLDIPQIGTTKIPVLLYTDDAVLLARTPNALRRLIDNFVYFMGGLDLKTNYAKSKIMCCGPLKYKLARIK